MIPRRIVIVVSLIFTLSSAQFIDDDDYSASEPSENIEETTSTSESPDQDVNSSQLSPQFLCPTGYQLSALTRRCEQITTTTTVESVEECPFAPEIIAVQQVHQQHHQEHELITSSSYFVVDKSVRRHQPAITTCSNGYTWNGVQCMQIVTADAQCDGDHYTLINGTCQMIHSGYCPPEYSLQANGECVYLSDSMVECPADHIWDGLACVHTIPSCPIGYSLGSAGMCQRQTAGSCPPNRQLVNGRCRASETVAIQCPPGFERVGAECVHRSDGICSPGYRINNGRCVTELTEAPQYSCPNETLLVSGSQCIAFVDLCPGGYAYAESDRRCVLVSMCPSGFTFKNNQCIRYKCAPPPKADEKLPFCPAGYELRNITCYKISIWPLIPTDNNPIERVTELPINPTIPPIQCGPNFVQFNETTCGCAVGTDNVNGVCLAPAIELHENEETSCNSGFTVENGVCVSVKTTLPAANEDETITIIDEPPTVSPCLSGYTFYSNGSCLIDDGNPSPPPPKPQPKPQICPNGYTLINGQCIQSCNATTCDADAKKDDEIITLPPTCPFGYTLIENGKCIKTQPKCPDHYIFVGRACYPKHVVNTESPSVVPSTTPLPENSTKIQHNNLTSTLTTTTFRCSGNGNDNECEIVNTIYNNNTIYQPTNVVTTNENNVIINLWKNGRLHSITRNNETIFAANETRNVAVESTTAAATPTPRSTDDVRGEPSEDGQEEISNKCCEVVSPRQCKRNETTAEWHCYHRRYQRCGSFCTQSVVQLAPRHTLYRQPILMMPPPPIKYSRLLAYRLQFLGRGVGEFCI